MKQHLGALLLLMLIIGVSGCATKSERLGKVLSVTLESFYSVEDIPVPKQAVGLRIENKAQVAVKALKGRLIIADLFGQEIRSFDVVIDKAIPPDSVDFTFPHFEYDRLNSAHTRLKGKSISQVKAIWEPEKILYLDGTVLE